MMNIRKEKTQGFTNSRARIALGVFVLLGGVARAQTGGDIRVTGSIVAGAGTSASSDGRIAVVSSVGHPSSGTMSGGSYTVSGGLLPAVSLPPPCLTDADCDDGNVCSIDECDQGRCVYAIIDPCCPPDGSCPVGPPEPDPAGVCSGGSVQGLDCDADLDCTGGGTCVSQKCRFISFSVTDAAGAETAIRVSSNSLHHPNPPYAIPPTTPFTSFETGTCDAPGEAAGCARWVGPPATYIESEAVPTAFQAAKLQCTPHFQVWPAGTLHVYGAEIVPSSTYDVTPFADAGGHTLGAAGSTVQIATTRWGEVDAPYQPPGVGQPDFSDVSALLNKFQSLLGAPIKAQGLLSGNDLTTALEVDLGFNEIAACLNAFGGLPYPHSGPCVCPSTATCPTLDACGRCTP